MFTLEIDFSPNLVSVIPSISSLESREHNSSSNRFRFLDKLLIILQGRIEKDFASEFTNIVLKLRTGGAGGGGGGGGVFNIKSGSTPDSSNLFGFGRRS